MNWRGEIIKKDDRRKILLEKVPYDENLHASGVIESLETQVYYQVLDRQEVDTKVNSPRANIP